mmetsp:Transcript_8444/g.28329  ORF Transcript_8444/g.28329 Transcript_8444/m.28329 type:complete len:419 (-) Transcript_8444:11-1267(-)
MVVGAEEACLLTAAEAREWRYRGEGSMNLVMAYIGDKEGLQGKVLRLRKAPIDSDESFKCASIEESYAFLQRQQFSKLDGSCLPRGLLVLVSRDFLASVKSSCHGLRPAHRLTRDLDLTARSGWLLPDLVSVPKELLVGSKVFLGIEIKPKCGTLPDRKLLSSATAIKAQVSRYRMMQYEKLRTGKITSISSYDPLDLFSGDLLRMQTAVRNMMQDPQNVFRVWVCSGPSSAIRHLGSEEELREVLGSPGLSRSWESEEDFCRLFAKVVQHSKVLVRIRELQALDALDIENIYHMHRCLANPDEYSEADARSSAPAKLPPVGDWDRLIEEYLIAHSAKDCSVIFTLTMIDKQEHDSSSIMSSAKSHGFELVDESESCAVLYRFGVIDLDIKLRTKIPEYMSQDSRILEGYLEHNADKC